MSVCVMPTAHGSLAGSMRQSPPASDRRFWHCPRHRSRTPGRSVEAICQRFAGLRGWGVAVGERLSKLPRSWRSLHHACRAETALDGGGIRTGHRACGPQWNRHVRLRPSDPERSKCPSLTRSGRMNPKMQSLLRTMPRLIRAVIATVWGLQPGLHTTSPECQRIYGGESGCDP